MAYIEGDGRNQGTLFPMVLDDLVPPDHMCRVIDAFVEQLDMEKLGFERAQPAETGARIVRCKVRNRSRDDGIQPQAHDKCTRRSQTEGNTSTRLTECRFITHNPEVREC